MIPPDVYAAYFHGVDLSAVDNAASTSDEAVLLGHPCTRPDCKGRLVHMAELDDIDARGTRTYFCNSQFCSMVGYDLEEGEEDGTQA